VHKIQKNAYTNTFETLKIPGINAGDFCRSRGRLFFKGPYDANFLWLACFFVGAFSAVMFIKGEKFSLPLTASKVSTN